MRRTRLTDRRQLRLWPNWRHFAFLTDLDGDAASVDAFHREHAVVELDIRDLKEGAGLEHLPSGNFHANSAWLQCAVLAHNLIRWTATTGQPATAEARRSPHVPDPPRRCSRPPRQPRRHTHPAGPAQLAMAAMVRAATLHAARTAARPRVAREQRLAHRTRPPCADTPTEARSLDQRVPA